MGIIIRQSVKQAIVSYTAIIIAAAAQLFIFPMDDLVTYGRAQKMFAIIFICYPIMFFGMPHALIKFFGEFGESKKGYLLNFLILALTASLIIGSVIYLFRAPLFEYKPTVEELLEGEEIWNFENYIPYIAISILVLVLFKMFAWHMSNYQRIVWPAIFETLWTKLALALLILGIILGIIPKGFLEQGIMIYFIVALVGVIIYAAYLGKLNLSYNPDLFKKENIVRIGRYAGYSGLTLFGGMLAIRLDAFIAQGYVSDKMMGIYMWFVFMGTLIDTPGRSVSGISSPIISKAISRGDFDEVNTVYRKSTITLFLVGIAMYCLILLSIEDLILWIGKTELLVPFILIFGILGLVRVMQSTMVMSGQILLYSKYYRVMLYITLMMGVINIVLNYWFITDIFSDQKLFGLCYATAISITAQFAIVGFYVWTKFHIHPFSKELLYGIICMILCFTAAYFIPMTNTPLLNIVLRSAVFGLPFLYLIYRFRLSPDINSIIDLGIEKIKNRDFKNII